jgi:hypothetical protein
VCIEGSGGSKSLDYPIKSDNDKDYEREEMGAMWRHNFIDFGEALFIIEPWKS